MEIQDSGLACLDSKAYLGIGIQYDLNDLVIVAPESYPAYKAGIRLGDEVLNPDFEPDADGYEIVEFKREGKHHWRRIKTQRICLR